MDLGTKFLSSRAWVGKAVKQRRMTRHSFCFLLSGNFWIHLNLTINKLKLTFVSPTKKTPSWWYKHNREKQSSQSNCSCWHATEIVPWGALRMELQNAASHGDTVRGAHQNSSNLNANNDGADDNYSSDFSPTRSAKDAKFLSLINCDEGL